MKMVQLGFDQKRKTDIRMKTIVYTLSSLLFVFYSCSRKPSACGETTIDGFLVTRLLRSEVELTYQNLQRKNRGQPYSVGIDTYHETYFVPKDSIATELQFAGLVANHTHNYNRRAFILPSQHTKLFVSKYCDKKFDESWDHYQLDSERYFEVEADSASKYVYSIWRLKGMAIHSVIDNTFFNRRYLGLRYVIDAELTKFDCYFVYEMKIDEVEGFEAGFRPFLLNM